MATQIQALANAKTGATRKPRRGHEFTPDEIDRALTAIALAGGNCTRARETLKLDSTFPRVPTDRVMQLWKHKHAARYEEIRTERAPGIEAAAVHDYRAIVVQTAQTHLKAVEQADHGIGELDARDAAAVAKNLAIAGGVAADKLLLFTDRPNVRVERRDPDAILREIERIIPGTAEDITDATEATSEALIRESAEPNPRELPSSTTS